MLHIDLETRSQVDLIKRGLTHYAQDNTTEVICMAYAFDMDPIKFWWADEDFPQEVIDYFNSDQPVMAHNAEFERSLFDYVISHKYDFDAPLLTSWRCSMAMSLVSGFAGGLDAATHQAGVPYTKHTAGTRLISEYCAPFHKDIFHELYAEDKKLMQTYCELDVECMRALSMCCRDLTEEEWEEYYLNCKINDRGLPIDVDFCDQAIGFAAEVADDANAHIERLTGGAMKKHTARKERDKWLFPKLTKHQMGLLEVYKKGEKKQSMDWDHRQYLLNCEDLDADARELLEYIDSAGSSVLKKYSTAFYQHIEGRVHNTYLWNGAGRTGRFSGRGLQPHNMRRDVFPAKEAERLIKRVKDQKPLDHPADDLARLIRPTITHKNGLYWVDWSSIEGRVAPWLSVGTAGEAKLDLYREKKDVYVVTAAEMFDVAEEDVDKDFRQSGKIAELSLQFGGGASALIGMAKNFGIIFDDDTAKDIVRNWRRSNPWAEEIWADYQTAIDNAVRGPGEEFAVGRVVYFSDDDFLWCQLPSERMLAYPRPLWETYFTPWDEERVGPTFQTHFKPAAGDPPLRNHARGALLFQNTVQAVAADLLRESLLLADDKGLNIVGHTHDEIIGIGSDTDGAILNKIMLETPWWAEGLPIATGGVTVGTRYGK